MLPPDELMMDTLLPSLRHLLAKELSSRGLTQEKVSRSLGVTQASVSNYLSSPDGVAYGRLLALGITRAEAVGLVSSFSVEVARGPIEAQAALQSFWRTLLESGRACPAHRARYPSLADCEVCLKEPKSLGARAEAVYSVDAAVRALEAAPVFAAIIPQVGANLAYAIEGAKSVDEVVAVPGRVVRVRGRAVASRSSEFGASGHLARLLLAVSSFAPHARACINVRYDGRMDRALKDSQTRCLFVGGHSGSIRGDPTEAALSKALTRTPGDFDAVVDRGGTGIEPSAYLFGRTPMDVVQRALGLAARYSRG